MFEKPAGYWDRKPSPYTLEDHTLRVLRQFEKYFADKPLPHGISKPLFRLLLVLHDIGKPLTEGEESTIKQHEYTPQVIDALRPVLPFKQQDIDLIIGLIQGDCIGSYLSGKLSLQDAIKKIEEFRPPGDLSP